VSDGEAGNHVILQISSTAVPDSKLKEYLKDVRRNELRRYELAPGLDSVCLLQKAFVAYVEVVIMSIWRSEGALKRFSESWPSRDGVVSEYGGIQFEPRIYSVMMFCKGTAKDVEFE
jgi:heme-degrading monooxygenase HmoA